MIEVVDGDTLRVTKGRGDIFSIRLFGIDCPEKAQSFGIDAAKFTSDLCLNETILYQQTERDGYGRVVATVTLLDGLRILNQELVRAGMAHWYEKYAPRDQVLSSLQREAQSANRGLWSQQNPVPPWVFRSK